MCENQGMNILLFFKATYMYRGTDRNIFLNKNARNGILCELFKKLAIRFTKQIASFEADCDVFLKKLEIRFKTQNPLHKVDCECDICDWNRG